MARMNAKRHRMAARGRAATGLALGMPAASNPHALPGLRPALLQPVGLWAVELLRLLLASPAVDGARPLAVPAMVSRPAGKARARKARVSRKMSKGKRRRTRAMSQPSQQLPIYLTACRHYMLQVSPPSSSTANSKLQREFVACMSTMWRAEGNRCGQPCIN